MEIANHWLAISGAVALLLAGLGAEAEQAASSEFGDYQPKGFLSDYANLVPEGGDSEAYIYSNPAIDGTRYRRVMVERIKLFFKEDAAYKGIDPTELKELADYFHSAIVEALEDAYPVVEEAGPDVLRLRIAVADIVPTKPSASVVTLVVPFVWLGEAGAGVAQDKAGSTPFIGEATVEMEVLDSQTIEQVGAYIETHIGKKYHWTKGVGTAVKDYTKAFSTWAYVKQAMDRWAQFIRQRLDKAHGKTKAE